MDRQEGRTGEDLFLELANDHVDVRASNHRERAVSRLAFAADRRSLPPLATEPLLLERRPGSSSQVQLSRPGSRLDVAQARIAYGLDRLHSPHSLAARADDAVDMASHHSIGHGQRTSERPPQGRNPPSRLSGRVRHSDLAQPDRRRLSLTSGSFIRSHNESPGNGRVLQDSSPPESIHRRPSLPDSASVDSQTAPSAVWDELDDLKSRIKRLEFTGKVPNNFAAATSVDQGERPRTATTAPTTIDPSPKRDQDATTPAQADVQVTLRMDVSGRANTDTHPLLHAALAKAKPLLSPTLYRQLEATAIDAVQLAAMTGSAGPQGTAFSAVSIINGVNIADRQVRRKANAMCRNLTDLILSLCEGKHDPGGIMSSPAEGAASVKSSPSLQFSRGSISQRSGSARPMSRLEARRVSILGSHIGTNDSLSENGEEHSAPDSSPVPSRILTDDHYRPTRAGTRLNAGRLPQYDDFGGDEDPTVRPVSRARTEAGSFRASTATQPHRSPSLREALASRRAQAGAEVRQDTPQLLARVPSLGSYNGRRRLVHNPASTPSVTEESATADGDDGNMGDSSSIAPEQDSPSSRLFPSRQDKNRHSLGRRIVSVSHHAARRDPPTSSFDHRSRLVNAPVRTASLNRDRRLFRDRD